MSCLQMRLQQSADAFIRETLGTDTFEVWYPDHAIQRVFIDATNPPRRITEMVYSEVFGVWYYIGSYPENDDAKDSYAEWTSAQSGDLETAAATAVRALVRERNAEAVPV